MASFIAHSVTGAFIYAAGRGESEKHQATWLLWLVFLSMFPDVDYGMMRCLGVSLRVRFTHSLAFCSLLPMLNLMWLIRLSPADSYGKCCIQIFGAAYSHLLLDLLTGVSRVPLLWPATDILFKLPFGIFPSAGKMDIANSYFYRNILIEMGILLPAYSLLLMKNATKSAGRLRQMLLRVFVLLPFLTWGILLDR